MNKMILALILVSGAVTAAPAEWQLLGGHIPVLYPKEEHANVLLMIGDRKTFAVSIMDVRGKVDFDSCAADEMREATEVPPLTVNGKSVKFQQACLSGTGILVPQTDKGKSYLNDLVFGGKGIEIKMNNGLILHYPSANIDDLKNKLKQQDNAM